MKPAYQTIDEYIAGTPEGVQPVLRQMREVIRENAPETAEKISWNMPTFYLNGNLVHFMAHKNHIGLYPGAEGIGRFAGEFDSLGLRYFKGAVQFPLGRDMPWELIGRIVRFRVEENTNGD
ncbi:iron chaperone [Faecalispora jeddahensis]|uniref:iron chaperone n=1 Tax=Faecalispora jeddahensis TaxID=1414721 RepID=UPI0027B89E17|nr:DUF1801 domain-containing protein [Faecalispora jeddahensis]